ncbi:TonB-dependent receptor [Sediminibacterium ginsengisoli]|uniref:Outer membrane receptor proteins, mostly Fe transport n=1 Tax=Sediminibacterium ginsengisoli TaxID=413434 RepID=A0A1T4MCZ5_9BACT|nr:TonB-dependent receptor [Sediminibacterium ginsengisoli]SJZ64751.1 Outer membrane receptor proteins, mostly Fe transport [Sediminibacterium ginsengisoli]
MNLILTAIASLLFFLGASAQQLSGSVSDQLSKAPLPNASVQLTNAKDSTLVLRTTTDTKGRFSFRVAADNRYNLKVEYTGYQTLTQNGILPGTPLTLAMQLENKQLQGVTVSATAQKPFITMAADKMTLNVANSPIAAGGNAYDVILRAPGLTEQNNSLNLNGKSVNVLIDGRPANLTGEQLKTMLSNMPAAGISKVEVMSNPSARYDAQGASIINIILAKNQNFGVNGTFTQGVGIGNYLRGNSGLSLNYRNRNVNVYGSYDYMHIKQKSQINSSRFLSASSHIETEETEIRNRNNHAYKLGLDYDISKRSSAGILVKGFTNYQDRDVTNRAVIDQLSLPDSSSVVRTSGKARFFNPSVNVYFKTTLDSAGKKELSLNADYFNYNKRWSDDFNTRYYDGTGTEYQVPFILMNNSPANNNITTFTADYSETSRFGKWEAGVKTAFTKTDNDVLWQQLENNTWKTDAGKTNHFIFRENIGAAYVTLAKTIKKLSLQAGLRLEHTESEGFSVTLNQVNKNNYTNLFPNLSLMYMQSTKQQFGISYRKSIQRFGFDYVNPFVVYQNQYAYSQGNPNIQPMIMHSIELSHSYNYKLFSKLSYTRINNVLGPVYRQDPVNKVVISSYGNLNTADVFSGTVTSMKSFFKGRWSSVTTAGAFYARYNTTTGGSEQNAKVTAIVSSNNTVLLPGKIKAEVNIMYLSPIASGVYQQKSLYFVNTGFSKNILQSKGTLALNISDIFNTQRARNDVMSNGVNMSSTVKPDTRVANLVFTYRFGNNKVKAAKVRKTSNEDEKTRVGAGS